MSFLRSVLSDLVEKRLWPVAVALLVALIAIPVLLGGGGTVPVSDDATPAGPVASVSGVDGLAVVSLDTASGERRDRPGATRNPFEQRRVKAADVVKAPVDAVKTTGSTPPATGGKDDAGTTTPDTAPAAPAPGKADPGIDDTYSVTVRFGEAGDLKRSDNIRRLTPLPSRDNPFIIFLGVLADGKTAVFLVSSDAVPTGDGVCKPSKDSCETIRMQAGDTEFFDLAQGAAGVVQYQLDLVSVRKAKASSTTAAAASHGRESKAGREFLRGAVSAELLEGWSYDRKFGVLVPPAGEAQDEAVDSEDASLKAESVAHVPGQVADEAAGAWQGSGG